MDLELHQEAREVAGTLRRILAADEGEMENRLKIMLMGYEPEQECTVNEVFRALFNVSLDDLLVARSLIKRRAS